MGEEIDIEVLFVKIENVGPLFFTAHSGRVSDLKFLPDQEWLISVGRDKTFQFYCTKTGRKLGTYEAQAWCMAVEYPFSHV